MDKNQHEVYFLDYCVKCKHLEKRDTEDPCNECIEHSWNINSHKPVKFEEK